MLYIFIFLIHVCASITYAMDGGNNNIVFTKATNKRKRSTGATEFTIVHQPSPQFLQAFIVCKNMLKDTIGETLTVLDTQFSKKTFSDLEKAVAIFSNHQLNHLEQEQALFKFLRKKNIKQVCKFLKATDFYNNERMQTIAARTLGNHVFFTALIPSIYEETKTTLAALPHNLFTSVVRSTPQILHITDFFERIINIKIKPEANFNTTNPIFFTSNHLLYIANSHDIYPYDITTQQTQLAHSFHNMGADYVTTSPDRSYAAFNMVPLTHSVSPFVVIDWANNKNVAVILQQNIDHPNAPFAPGAIADNATIVFRQQENDPSNDTITWQKQLFIASMHHMQSNRRTLDIQPQHLSFLNDDTCFIADNKGKIVILNIQDDTKEQISVPLKNNIQFTHVTPYHDFLITDDKKNQTIVRDLNTQSILAGIQSRELKMSKCLSDAMLAILDEKTLFIRDLRTNNDVILSLSCLPGTNHFDVSNNKCWIAHCNGTEFRITDMRCHAANELGVQQFFDNTKKYHQLALGNMSKKRLGA